MPTKNPIQENHIQKNSIYSRFLEEDLEEVDTNVNHRRLPLQSVNPPTAQTEFSATQFKRPDYRYDANVIAPHEAAFAQDLDSNSSGTTSTHNTGKEILIVNCSLGKISKKDKRYITTIKSESTLLLLCRIALLTIENIIRGTSAQT